MLHGFTSTYKLTCDGKRQVMALHVPGDIPDLQSLHLKVLDNSLATLCPSTLAFIQHEDLRRVCDRHPRIASALWRGTLVDVSIFREWLLNIGRHEAYARMARLLCELLARLEAVGLATESGFDLPVTQVQLADAVGTSAVHVNRVLQAMRADGLIQTRGAQIVIPDRERLEEAGEFDPLYLHLIEGAPA